MSDGLNLPRGPSDHEIYLRHPLAPQTWRIRVNEGGCLEFAVTRSANTRRWRVVILVNEDGDMTAADVITAGVGLALPGR